MADDKMKNDDLQRNMGAGDKDPSYGQQSPGRTGHGETGGEKAGQHTGGQKTGGQQAGQKGTRNMEDDEKGLGTGKAGTQNRGGQNR